MRNRLQGGHLWKILIFLRRKTQQIVVLVQLKRLTKVWMSSLDTRVRKSHRKLDGQKADNEGY